MLISTLSWCPSIKWTVRKKQFLLQKRENTPGGAVCTVCTSKTIELEAPIYFTHDPVPDTPTTHGLHFHWHWHLSQSIGSGAKCLAPPPSWKVQSHTPQMDTPGRCSHADRLRHDETHKRRVFNSFGSKARGHFGGRIETCDASEGTKASSFICSSSTCHQLQ